MNLKPSIGRASFADLIMPGARANVHRYGHVHGCIEAVKGNCGPLTTDQRDGLFDACNRALTLEGRSALSRDAFDEIVGHDAT